MKKKTLLLFLVCALLASLVWSGAVADEDDPLASLSYLTGAFKDMVEEEVEDRLDDSDEELLEEVEDTGSVSVDIAANWEERCMEQEDMLLATTGTGAVLLSGSAEIHFDSGAVVDVTTGTAVETGSSMEKNHRYMAAEDTSAAFMVTSPTAVINYQGVYDFYDSDLPDYYAMADALKYLDLFRGTDTTFARGYALEDSTTRIQALIMFIRVLGEEEEALAWEGSMPFKDVPQWAVPYVGYAYEMGYTNGTSPTEFMPDMAANVNHYTEFMLRAMEYSSTATSDITDALWRACDAEVLTEGEAETFSEIDRFLRSHMVYISYYALDAQLPDGLTLSERLQDKDMFSAKDWKTALKMVETERF